MATSYVDPPSPPSSASPFAWAPPPLISHQSFEQPPPPQAQTALPSDQTATFSSLVVVADGWSHHPLARTPHLQPPPRGPPNPPPPPQQQSYDYAPQPAAPYGFLPYGSPFQPYHPQQNQLYPFQAPSYRPHQQQFSPYPLSPYASPIPVNPSPTGSGSSSSSAQQRLGLAPTPSHPALQASPSSQTRRSDSSLSPKVPLSTATYSSRSSRNPQGQASGPDVLFAAGAHATVNASSGPLDEATLLAAISPYSFASSKPPQQETESDRPFKCVEAGCTMSFNRNHDLKRHSRIHLDLKPFECHACHKAFSRKDALRRHQFVKGCGGEETTANSTSSVHDLYLGSSQPKKRNKRATSNEETSPLTSSRSRKPLSNGKGKGKGRARRGPDRNQSEEDVDVGDGTARGGGFAGGERGSGEENSGEGEGGRKRMKTMNGAEVEENRRGDDDERYSEDDVHGDDNPADGQQTPPPILQAYRPPPPAVHVWDYPNGAPFHHPSSLHLGLSAPHPNLPYTSWTQPYPPSFHPYPQSHQAPTLDSRSNNLYDSAQPTHQQPSRYPSHLSASNDSAYRPHTSSTPQTQSHPQSVLPFQPYQDTSLFRSDSHSPQPRLSLSPNGHVSSKPTTPSGTVPSVLAPGPSIPISTVSRVPSVLRPGPSPPRTATAVRATPPSAVPWVRHTAWGRPVEDEPEEGAEQNGERGEQDGYGGSAESASYRVYENGQGY